MSHINVNCKCCKAEHNGLKDIMSKHFYFYAAVVSRDFKDRTCHSHSAGLVDFYIQVNQTSTITMTLQKTNKTPPLIHSGNFACGKNIKIILHNFFQPIALSNNQQQALTQDIIGKQ